MVLLDVLHARDQPYNMLVRDHSIHIIPRQMESSLAECSHLGFRPAMVELFGIFLVKSASLWEEYAERREELVHMLAQTVREKVSLSEEVFEEIKKALLKEYEQH